MARTRHRAAGIAALTVVSATTITVAANFATSWKQNYWAWTAVSILTVAAAVLAILATRPTDDESLAPVADATITDSSTQVASGSRINQVKGSPGASITTNEGIARPPKG